MSLQGYSPVERKVMPIFTFLFCAMFTFTGYPNGVITSNPDSANHYLTIIGVGDIMFGTDFPNKGYLPPKNDCLPLIQPAIDVLQNADITFGNLEGCFLNEGEVAKRCSDSTRCFAFKMPEEYVHCLSLAGFDVVSLANNHIGDFGEKGRQTTMRLLDSVGIQYGGLLTHPTAVFEKNGLKIGFGAFAPNVGTCNINDIPGVKRIVEGLKSQCDIVIVSFHGGAEGANHAHVNRETEYFYGENRSNVYEFARHAIDAGADVVFGHGPHVTRAVDLYKGRFIAYSLGNFCTYGRFNLKGINGIAPIVKLYLEKNGKFVKGEIVPIIQPGNGGVVMDSQKQAIKAIQRLTIGDFPESQLNISNDGKITIKE
ncbi:MAG TPA: CapA family protein [Tenuifilaceae bacterium]|jgi:hypothetical protein|nr:CapA family protein [Bacteroidota bacterium]MZP83000.1 CapA family protein [Bacteroidales bacterium]NLH56679.1 CapA family protein [Rikenellaceae bacterium]OQC62815.1 MAG: Capsule biosynthesis protein CapA [Bacteroidetes bacterium ADurb.Bin008]HNV81857.1 CapA family protein [Tenuifilaceae bacterium]